MRKWVRDFAQLVNRETSRMRERNPDIVLMRIVTNYEDGTFLLDYNGERFDRVPSQDPNMKNVLKKDDTVNVGFEDAEWPHAFIIGIAFGVSPEAEESGWPTFGHNYSRSRSTGIDEDGPSLASDPIPIFTAIDQNAHRTDGKRIITWRRKVAGGDDFEIVAIAIDAREGEPPDWTSDLPSGLPLSMTIDESGKAAYIVQYPGAVVGG